MIRYPPRFNYWKRIILSQFHKRNLRFVAIEIFKFKRGLVPAQCKEMIPQNKQNRYELWNNVDFTLPMLKSVHKSLESLIYLGPKIWEILSVEIKQTESLLEFKTKIENWNSQGCPCHFGKVYLQHIGFI